MRHITLDHILISRNVKDACLWGGVDARAVPRGDDPVSDHRALVVELDFRG